MRTAVLPGIRIRCCATMDVQFRDIAWRRADRPARVALTGQRAVAIFPTGRMVGAKTRAFLAFIEAELRETTFRPGIASNESPILALNRGTYRSDLTNTESTQGVDETGRRCTEPVARERRSVAAE